MKVRSRKTRLCKMPSPGNIAGRSSSITNAFFNAIVPVHEPTEEEELEALRILGMKADDVRCAYCGDKSTEWDHLRPIITGQKPTGYITEIANLVPACGKCNQSKGKSKWIEWMRSPAPLSPKSRGVEDLEERIEKLTLYAMWKPPTRIEFDQIVDSVVWERHEANWKTVLGLLKESQKLAKEIRLVIENAPRHQCRATGQITYGTVPQPVKVDDGRLFTTEEVVERINATLKSHGGEPIEVGRS